MSIYMTETEQVEWLKAWWKRHNQVITIVLSVLLIAFSGTKYWFWHQQKALEQASNTYEHLMISVSNNDTKSVRSYAHQLIESYPATVYADTAYLVQAKLEIAAGHYAKARMALTAVVAHSKFKMLVDVARLRLARVLAYEKSYDLALHELEQVRDPAYRSIQSELRGDVYYASGQYQQAREAYQSAKEGVEQAGINNIFLDMKQHDVLALMKTSMAVS